MNTIIPEVIYERNSFENAWYRALNHVLKTHNEITFGGKVKDKVPVQYEKKIAIPISIDQWNLAKEDLAQQIETGIQSNRNVVVIGNPSIDRFEIPDSPPCLREIWIRYAGESNVIVKTVWRSRDLYGALMTNIAGLLSAVMREVIIPNGCKLIQYVDKSHSLHIYKYDWESASKVKPIPINPMLMNR